MINTFEELEKGEKKQLILLTVNFLIIFPLIIFLIYIFSKTVSIIIGSYLIIRGYTIYVLLNRKIYWLKQKEIYMESLYRKDANKPLPFESVNYLNKLTEKENYIELNGTK